MGCSPYFAITGTHPLLPLDIIEANYLLPAPELMLSTMGLIARRAIALQKRQEDLRNLHSRIHEARNKATICFEREHLATIRDFDFKQGDLVLICNTAIEKALNRKMRPRYLGPMIIVSCNKGGAYIICDLDGTLLHAPIAAFRVIPYFTRQVLIIPDIDRLIDVSITRLRELERDDNTQLEEHSDERIVPDLQPQHANAET
jgi:hypothetical protein